MGSHSVTCFSYILYFRVHEMKELTAPTFFNDSISSSRSLRNADTSHIATVLLLLLLLLLLFCCCCLSGVNESRRPHLSSSQPAANSLGGLQSNSQHFVSSVRLVFSRRLSASLNCDVISVARLSRRRRQFFPSTSFCSRCRFGCMKNHQFVYFNEKTRRCNRI